MNEFNPNYQNDEPSSQSSFDASNLPKRQRLPGRDAAPIDHEHPDLIQALKACSAHERAFVLSYLGPARFNASEAALDAGHGVKHRGVHGYTLLRKPRVQNVLKVWFRAKCMDADECLSRLADIARIDACDFAECYREELILDPEGKVVGSARRVDWQAIRARGLGHLVKKVTASKFGDTIEFEDRLKAIDLIGRTHGLWGSSGSETVNNLLVKVDWPTLSDEQLRQISEGIPLRKVVSHQ